MPTETKPTSTPTAASLLTATHAETQAVHADTTKILSLLDEPQGDGEQDRIDQILSALAEVLTSLSALHAKLDALAAPGAPSK